MSKLKVEKTLLKKAKEGDLESIKSIFKSFIGNDQQIFYVDSFGKYGLIFPDYSFACVTDKKICSLRIGYFGEIVYQDAFIEEINSGVIYQPSVFKLYFVSVILCLSIVGIILLNAWVRLYYTLNKSGLVWSVREGINVYVFANRSKIDSINNMWRIASNVRCERVNYLKTR
jgi:hypothetical protein